MTAPRSSLTDRTGRTGRAGRLRWVALVAFALMTSLYAWWPVLAAYPATQGGDGPVFQKALEAEHEIIARYHELPMWNPYECGGLPLWDNPQGPAGAPLVLLMFVTNTTKTMMAWYVLHSAAGFICMWILARKDLKLSRPAAVLASLAWAYSGFHQQHYAGGHFVFVPFLYLPLALYLWRRAEHDLRAAGGLAILVAWMFHEGAVYPLPHLMLVLGAETLMRLWPIRRLKAIVRAAVVVGVLAFLLAASRMLPVADQLRAHVRPIGVETDSLQWDTLKAMFLDRAHARGVPGQTYVWPEYGTYFGPLLVFIAIAGMIAGGLESFWLFALMLFCGALMWGHAGRFAPWHMLKSYVFPFKEMRVPSRFRDVPRGVHRHRRRQAAGALRQPPPHRYAEARSSGARARPDDRSRGRRRHDGRGHRLVPRQLLQRAARAAGGVDAAASRRPRPRVELRRSAAAEPRPHRVLGGVGLEPGRGALGG
jgi:hypothetical protein